MTATAPRFTAADLAFEPETHTYTLPDGAVVPSVTQILKETGVSVDFDALMETSARRAQAITLRRQLGTAVHVDCHAFDDDDILWESVDHRVLPYVKAWEQFRSDRRLRPLTRERRVYHPGLRFCGTLDGIFYDKDRGKVVLIDIKIGDPEDAGARYQTAAYELAWLAEERDAPAIQERWSVRLLPEQRVPYAITRYADWMDGRSFQSFVTTFYCQAARRRKP